MFGNEVVSSVLCDGRGRGHPRRFTSEPAVLAFIDVGLIFDEDVFGRGSEEEKTCTLASSKICCDSMPHLSLGWGNNVSALGLKSSSRISHEHLEPNIHVCFDLELLGQHFKTFAT